MTALSPDQLSRRIETVSRIRTHRPANKLRAVLPPILRQAKKQLALSIQHSANHQTFSPNRFSGEEPAFRKCALAMRCEQGLSDLNGFGI